MINYLNTYRRYACDIGRINDEAKRCPEEFIIMTENVFRHELRLIVDQICSVPGDRHVVLLSGPSSSGKTTCSKRLADEFRIHGYDTQLISMDDFYLGIDNVDKTPEGKPDFESVRALDIPLIKKSITELSESGECIIPKYDFAHSRRSDRTETIKLSDRSVIIMEGIHALNPIFSEGMSREKVMKIYVSVKQGIKDNEYYVLTNRDIRFIRRLVRDHFFRKVDPQYMLSMWNSVVDGEKSYIRPYRYTSDFTINSIHIYEPCIMRNTALKLLSEIPQDSEERSFIDRIMSALERFESIDPKYIPRNSLIREFIGGSCYSY